MLSQSRRRNKIGLLGPYSFGNLGNASLQKALIQQIDKYFPGSEIYGCYIDPQRKQGDHQVLPFPFNRRVPWSEPGAAPNLRTPLARESSAPPRKWIGWVKRIPLVNMLYGAGRDFRSTCRDVKEECAYLLKCYGFVKNFKLLIVGLGGVIDDTWNGAWGDPFSLFKWAILAKITRTRFIFLSVGAEKIETTLGKFFLKQALALADFRSYRDAESKQRVEQIGVAGPNHVFPDLAFSLEMRRARELELHRSTDRLVGVSPMAYCDPRVWPVKDPAVYQGYLETLSDLVSWLLRRGYKVALFVTQIRMDKAPLAELREMVRREAPPGTEDRLFQVDVQTVEECLSFVSRLKLVITSRLHGVILPLLEDTPVLAISPADKIDSLMANMGLSEYCVNLHAANLNSLSQKILDIEANEEILRSRIHKKVEEYRVSAKKQFELVFRP